MKNILEKKIEPPIIHPPHRYGLGYTQTKKYTLFLNFDPRITDTTSRIYCMRCTAASFILFTILYVKYYIILYKFVLKKNKYCK